MRTVAAPRCWPERIACSQTSFRPWRQFCLLLVTMDPFTISMAVAPLGLSSKRKKEKKKKEERKKKEEKKKRGQVR